MNRKRISGFFLSALMVTQVAAFPQLEANGAEAALSAKEFSAAVRKLNPQNRDTDYYKELTFDREKGLLFKDGSETDTAANISVRNGKLMLQTNTLQRRPGSSVQSAGGYTAFEDAAAVYGYRYTENDGVMTITNEFQSARLIVKAKGSLDSCGAVSAAEGYRDLHIFQYADPAQAYEAYLQFDADPRVQFVQPSHRIQLDPVDDNESVYGILPSGSGHYMTWGADMIGTEDFIQTYLQLELLPQVKVAVIDTGINAEPSLFEDRILDGGLNFSDSGDDTVSDDLGHGTHCTGTICELTPSNVKILPVKVFDKKGHADDEQIYLGLMYAIEQGADILSMSFGGLGVSPLEVEALAEADRAGVICCAAAGNNGDDAMYYYPGGIDSAITVGAVNSNLDRAGFSNNGKLVDVVAPGVGIESYTIGGADKTEKMNGTSMATPHVTACYALLRSWDIGISPRRAEALLRLNAVDLGEKGFDKEFAWGLVCMKDFRWDEGICYAPEFSVKPGNYSSARTIELETETPDARIYYTTNGTEPSAENGTLYSKPLEIAVTTWIRAVTVKNGFIDSTVSETVYSINGMDVPVPFTVEDGVLKKYHGIRRQLSVPDAVDGQTITAIGKDAFLGCRFIEEVQLPEGVTSIQSGAFADCTELRKLTASGVVTLGDEALSGCSLLESVTLSDVVKSVGTGAFRKCSKLRQIQLPGLTAVPDECFAECQVLRNVMLPDALEFGARAFAGCSKLQKIEAPFHHVTGISDSAFSGCGSWNEALYLPALQSLGTGAFSGDSALKAVCLPDSFTELPAELFAGCSGLRLLVLPGVTKVGNSALALKKTSFDLTAEIPYGQITEVGNSAFNGFPFGNGMDTIQFSSLEKHGLRAFAGALGGVLDFPSLTSVPDEMFDNAKIKAVRFERAESLGRLSLGNCLSVVLTARCKEISSEAWINRSQNPVYICSAEHISATEGLSDFELCDEPLILRCSADSVRVPVSGYAPMQVCAAAPGITYEWLLVTDGEETVVQGANRECCEADTSVPGSYSYICRMTASNGKQDSVSFSVTVIEQAEQTVLMPQDGITDPITGGQHTKLTGSHSTKTMIRADGTAAVGGRLTDAAGRTVAVLTHTADGTAFMDADCGGETYCLRTEILWDGVYVINASDKPVLSLRDCTVSAIADTGASEPVITVRDRNGNRLQQDVDYVVHTSPRNHICTVSLLGTGRYSGSTAVTVPVYPMIVQDHPETVSLRGADDSAVFCFIPKTTGKYYIYASRTAGYAMEADSYNRLGVYSGGSRYVTIRTACMVSNQPDEAGIKLRYTDYSVPNGSYFSDEIEMNAGQPYYLICSAESAAEYAVVVSQEPAVPLRGATVTGDFYAVYSESAQPYKPVLKVMLQGRELTEGVDYLRVDNGNDRPGEATLTLIGMGRYTGKIDRSYDIIRRGTVTTEDYLSLDEKTSVSCANGSQQEIWFKAETGSTAKETVHYRIINKKISGGALHFTLFRVDTRTGMFTRVKPGVSNEYDLINGTYCLLLYPQYTEKGGEAEITVLIPHDLETAELTISDMPYTGGPIIPDLTMIASDGTELLKDVDFRLVFPVENGNVMFGECRYIIEPTERSFGTREGTFNIFVDLPKDAPLLETGDHSVLLSFEERLAVYRLSAEKETEYTLASSDAANIVLRVFSTEAEMLEQTYGAGTKSLSFTVPAGETRLIMVKFNGTIREGTIHFKLATDLRLLSDCEAETVPKPWTGSRVLPDLVFRDGDYVLQEGKDYELRYTSDDVNIGTATANYTGIGDYFGLCDVNYHIILPDLFEGEDFSPCAIQIDTEYDIRQKQLEDSDYLVYSYRAGTDTDLHFDIYNCMCRMTVQLYDNEGHFRDSIFMKSLGSMEFDIKAEENCYLLFSATDISGSNQETNFMLKDQHAGEYKFYEDTENGVTYRINASKKYAEVYAVDWEEDRVTLLPKVSGVPVKFVPEGLFVSVPDSCTVIGYAGCKAADYAGQYFFAYFEARESSVPGDLNNDGVFTVSDAVLFSRILNESDSILDLPVIWDRADVNGDGCLSLLDLSQMLKMLDIS